MLCDYWEKDKSGGEHCNLCSMKIDIQPHYYKPKYVLCNGNTAYCEVPNLLIAQLEIELNK